MDFNIFVQELSKRRKNESMERTKVLMASAPFDGHFDPLAPLAVALTEAGYDVRWYAQERYAPRLAKLQIPHFTFRTALQFHGGNINEIFPTRTTFKTQSDRINFDLQEIFIKRGPEYYEDIKAIHQEFPFEIMVADLGFTGIPFVSRLMRIPVIGVNVFPLMETSKQLPPYGLGQTPSAGYFGKIKMSVSRLVAEHWIFRKSNQLNREIASRYGIRGTGNLFDDAIYHSTIVMQSGTPGFEYKRKDMSDHIRFCGPLLPDCGGYEPFWMGHHGTFENTILVTQGMVEKDVEKLIVPTLKAYRGTNTRVIVTTGGSGTEELRRRFPESNFIIEDHIAFNEVMPYCDVFVTNGGYGGVQMGIQNQLPMVVAGIHEGKNEICARVDYFKLGINLQTEHATPDMVRGAVDKILTDPGYRVNVRKLSEEFAQYNPRFLIKKFVYMLGQQFRNSESEVRVRPIELSQL